VVWRVITFSAVAVLAPAQSIEVYSEFRRIGPTGEIVAPDQGGTPREILSPAIARNTHAGFFVVVKVPAGADFHLHIGQNPENALDAKLYKAQFRKMPAGWLADRLTPVTAPFTGRLPETGGPPGQTAVVFWMDVWVEPTAEVRRIKLEPQLNVGDHWIVYPMEVRIMPLVAPEAEVPVRMPPWDIAQRADTIALAQLRQYVCGSGADAPAGKQVSEPTVHTLLSREAAEDLALIRKLERTATRPGLIGNILRLGGAEDSKSWCAAPLPESRDWYLRVRDMLLRGGT
jgi:hypothetical protein